jgi:tartrate-resistant acid phosphatase type 5
LRLAVAEWLLIGLVACNRAEESDTDAVADTDTEADSDAGIDTDDSDAGDTDTDGPDTDTDVEDTDTDVPDTDTDVGEGVRFAVIGDFGYAGEAEEDVANLVKSWWPDFVITTGDNNYNNGDLSTIDVNIGQYYHEFIYPYAGAYGPGATESRFFPSLGNHDWYTPGAWPSIYWFELPGKEYYYDFVKGPVHFFAVDSNGSNPDGITFDSVQGRWLEAELAASTATWKVVYFHHPPYSSGSHGNNDVMQWPFAAWGADVVFCGHDHTVERLEVDGVTYVVQGTGGRSLYDFQSPLLSDSIVQFNADYGATLVEADEASFRIESWTRAGVLVDRYTVGEAEPTLTSLVPSGATWTYYDGGADPDPSWATVGFDDSAWASGASPLGYGETVATTVGWGPDEATKYWTTWFRTSFDVTDPAAFSELRVRLMRDDGAVVYLNGMEILRSSMPTGTITSSTPATADVNSGSESVWQPAWLPASGLVADENVLAIELHQSNPGSPDLKLDAILEAH